SSFSLPCPTAAPPTCWRNADGKRAELFRTDYLRLIGQMCEGLLLCLEQTFECPSAGASERLKMG
ncbi:hypothetical protein, partial [Paraburkholderia silvatlantica]